MAPWGTANMLIDSLSELNRQSITNFKFSIADISEETVKVLVSDESDLSALDYLRSLVRKPLTITWVSHEIIDRGVTSMHPSSEDHAPTEPSEDLSRLPELDSEAARDIAAIISASVDSGASDIHFEPGEQSLHCRVRVDGLLQESRRFPKSSALQMLARIKILAGLDIAEKRRPQDGRIRFAHNGRKVDIRVSVIPTAGGEKAVLRLLDKQQLRLQIDQLGFSNEQLLLFQNKISLPNGIILVTGPTGSGKTTTLYAALQHLNKPGVNISTVEDPIEYEIPGVNQTHVRPDIGVTFASLLRAMLRQDPNIIMIGEIRDQETLEIAIRASLTGHLVLSTVHTNSALATPARLIDMGAQSFLLASTLRLIMAQRLLRRVCPNCSTADIPKEQEAAAKVLGLSVSSGLRVGRGCDNCRHTGYKGRIVVAEFLDISDDHREAIDRRAPEAQLRKIAEDTGFKSMMAAVQHYIDIGATTPSEALRELQQ